MKTYAMLIFSLESVLLEIFSFSSFCRHGLVPHCHCHVSVTGLVSSVSTRGSEKAVAGSADWVLGTRRLLPAAGHDPGHEGGTLS